jgi:AcrR family transcriptional regulator
MAASPALKPSTRALLMQAGRDIVLAHGFQGLTVRAVAAAANANLGSFVYHFGTRDAFVEQLIDEWYAPLLSRVTGVVDATVPPLQRLRQAILQIVDFGIEHDEFIGRIFAAALAGDRSARTFLGSLAGRHPKLLLELIVASQAAGDLVEEDPLQVACFLMSSVGLPRLLATGWQGPPLFAKSISVALNHIARDRDRIVQRLDWALRGLSPRGPR